MTPQNSMQQTVVPTIAIWYVLYKLVFIKKSVGITEPINARKGNTLFINGIEKDLSKANIAHSTSKCSGDKYKTNINIIGSDTCQGKTWNGDVYIIINKNKTHSSIKLNKINLEMIFDLIILTAYITFCSNYLKRTHDK